MNWVVEFIRDPEKRFTFAVRLFKVTLVCWPTTHLLMIVLDPPENTWVFHVLMAISFAAIVFTALDIMATTDVRREQED